jgi:hypothetical protein
LRELTKQDCDSSHKKHPTAAQNQAPATADTRSQTSEPAAGREEQRRTTIPHRRRDNKITPGPPKQGSSQSSTRQHRDHKQCREGAELREFPGQREVVDLILKKSEHTKYCNGIMPSFVFTEIFEGWQETKFYYKYE